MITEHARLNMCNGRDLANINQIETQEIEQDEYIKQWDDYTACEIPSDR